MDLDPLHGVRPPGRIGRQVAALLAAVACFATEPAHASGSDDAADAIVAERPAMGWRWEASPRIRHFPEVPFDSRQGAPGAAAPIDYRLWLGDHRTEIGIGFGATSTRVLAFRHQISEHSRLTLEAPLGSSSDPLTGRTRRTALELGFESSRLQGLAKGTLLRAQLSAQSNLSLRLRGGRLGLYLGVKITGNE